MNQSIFAPVNNALFYFYNEALAPAAADPLLDRYSRRMANEFLPTMATSVVC